MQPTDILQVTDLGHQYQRQRGKVLEGVNLTLESGQIGLVWGASGSGKTTLLLACGGMLRPTQGQVTLLGEDLYRLSPSLRRRRRAHQVGYLFQTLALVPYLTLRGNVSLAPQVSRGQAEAVLERLGLAGLAGVRPDQLSQGQRQRAALARALAHQPRLLIADEPTGNLDSENAQRVFEALRHHADQGHAVLLAAHDSRAQGLADVTLALPETREEPAHA